MAEIGPLTKREKKQRSPETLLSVRVILSPGVSYARGRISFLLNCRAPPTSVGAALNGFTGILHIFAEPMGCAATCKRQGAGGDDDNHNHNFQYFHFFPPWGEGPAP